VRYVIAGEIRNTGMRQTSLLFGLWTKHHRAIELDLDVYDTTEGQLVARHRFSAEAEGDAPIGKQQVFGGQGFAAHPYGKVVLEVADQAAKSVLESLAGR
jgi:curli biogenesis system outer membrane secretion channel CsgG